MTEFTRSQLNTLRKQMQNALKMFGDKADITFDVGNCKYSGGEATFQLKCLLKGGKTREQEDFERLCKVEELETDNEEDYSKDEGSETFDGNGRGS